MPVIRVDINGPDGEENWFVQADSEREALEYVAETAILVPVEEM